MTNANVEKNTRRKDARQTGIAVGRVQDLMGMGMYKLFVVTVDDDVAIV